jgi:hypothetical protein
MPRVRPDVTADEVTRLYVDENLSGPRIAEVLRCSVTLVYQRLHQPEFSDLGPPPPPPSSDEVVRLYCEERWSTNRIGRHFQIDWWKIKSTLVARGVELRTPTEARQPRGRAPCPLSKTFRAYALGFATGDLHVYRVSPRGGTIIARCSTTKQEQRDVIRAVFGPFGPVQQQGLSIWASLGLSFGFLLDKYDRVVPEWVHQEPFASAYVAGYLDAEGSFGVYDRKGRLKVDSYDEWVLRWMNEWCGRIGVISHLRVIAHAGDPRAADTPFPKDLWRLTVNDMFSLLRLIATIDPFLRHGARRSDAERARLNILERLRSRAHAEQ